MFSKAALSSWEATVHTEAEGLKDISETIYGMPNQALSDLSTVPNIISAWLTRSLSLRRAPTFKHIAVTDWKKSTLVRGSLSIVPLTFCNDTSLVPIQFLAVDGASFKIIFGLPILVMIQNFYELEQQSLNFQIDQTKMKMNLEFRREKNRLHGSGTEYDNFTFTSNSFRSEIFSSNYEEIYVFKVLKKHFEKYNSCFLTNDDDSSEKLSAADGSEDTVFCAHVSTNSMKLRSCSASIERTRYVNSEQAHLAPPPPAQWNIAGILPKKPVMDGSLQNLRSADLPV